MAFKLPGLSRGNKAASTNVDTILEAGETSQAGALPFLAGKSARNSYACCASPS
jgi:hypothetical protein